MVSVWTSLQRSSSGPVVSFNNLKAISHDSHSNDRGNFCLLIPVPALAHLGGDSVSDFATGFSHPFGGFDHVLAIVAVGLFAAALDGRALWAVPTVFVSMMLLGGALGFSAPDLPGVEFGISLSVIVLGVIVMRGKTLVGRRAWSVGPAMSFVGAFALLHGYAHGTEIPITSGAASYMAGFTCATILLHGAGVLVGLSAGNRRHINRLAGVAIATAGVAIALT
jgi:urease accessory protein